jgi:peptide/nickel transport system substrate-binding protein
MGRRDSLFVLVFVFMLAAAGILVAVDATRPAVAPPITPAPTVAPEPRLYREGVLGRIGSVSPLTARTQADRDLVALLFAGLVRDGPSGTLVPDLAARWTTDEAGAVWTVDLRPDARWHDGAPVTADDVVYTIRTLQDPAYTGPRSSSWGGVTVRAVSERQVEFTLEVPVAGFLQALTQPIAPAHLLAEVPVEQLSDAPFGRAPVGSGPFELASLDDDTATLRPVRIEVDPGASPVAATAMPTDSLASPAPTDRPVSVSSHLDGLVFRYADDPGELIEAFSAGELDAVSGLSPTDAAALASAEDARLLRYPGSTLTAVILNLRPTHPEFRSTAVRTALLGALDRDAVVAGPFAGVAARADSLIPPTSFAFDPRIEAVVPYDVTGSTTALVAAGWEKVAEAWRTKDAETPFRLEVLSPDADSNPPVHAAAVEVVRQWRAFGLDAVHVALPPGEFVSGRLSTGMFSAAVVDIALGLDPDLYPLLASTQTLRGGSNVIGLQDPALDELLVAARKPASAEARAVAFSALQQRLASERYVLPLAFADVPIVVREDLSGPVVRLVDDPSDRFWDVLTWRLADDR